MGKKTIQTYFIFVLILNVFLIAGCDGGSHSKRLLQDITVSSTVPANNADGVPISSSITATFSEAMDPLTITTASFTVTGPGATIVSGAVTYAGVTAVFNPDSDLDYNTTYTATITTLATDLAGNALAADKAWTFATSYESDTTAPTVSSTVPANNTARVAISSSITATFSEAMDPLTITTASFTVTGPGATIVSGAVTYAGVTAIFNPDSDLDYSTTYVATITTMATDLAGNALAADKTWSFATGEESDTSAPTVSSTVPANNTPDVALNSNITATFSEAMDPLTITTASFTVTGPGATIVSGAVTYAGVTAIFNPDSDLDYSTTYVATITTMATDLAGNALVADKTWTFATSYESDTSAPTVSSTIPANNATGMAISSSITAAFSEAMDPLTITTASFMVTGPGATPVAGAVTYSGVTAIFNPDGYLDYSTTYTATITTMATDLSDNALAVNKIWSFTTGDEPDTTAPTVSSTVPDNTAGVAISSSITATFSEAMDPLTITTASFTVLSDDLTPVSGAVTYAGVTAVFTPDSDLAPNAFYAGAITTVATDLDGNALAINKIWYFFTGGESDTTAPTVSSTTPANNTPDVALNSNITASFSEAMDPLTITTASFEVTGPGATPVSGAVTYAGVTAVFNPDSDLDYSTTYTATITTMATDLAGNALAADKTWTFATSYESDTIAPTVSYTAPVNNALNMALNSNITITFNEAMDPLTITTASFEVTGPGATPVSGAVTYAGVTAVFNPDSDLDPNTTYTATITTMATDLAGNALAADKTWTFATSYEPDTTAPTVSYTAPVNNTPDVALNSNITATFSEAMDPLTITTTSFVVALIDNNKITPIPGAVTYSVVTAVFTPDSDLEPNAFYAATITTVATDLAGNALTVIEIWYFTTGDESDTTAPTVSYTAPANNTADMALNSNITASFSEAMDPLTITTASFEVTGPGATPVSGAVTYSGVTAIFNPDSDLAPNTFYAAVITTMARDLAGNALAADKVWTFATSYESDTTAPSVSSTIPANNTPDVALNSNITATFSEAMDPLTINTASFTVLSPDLTPVSGTVTYAGVTAVFNPDSDLDYSANYTVAITTVARDLAGNAMAANKMWGFSTAGED